MRGKSRATAAGTDLAHAKKPAMPVSELTDSNFEQATSSGVCVIDFWAPWCGPCRMQGPIFDSVSDDFAEKGKAVSFCKVNVDEQPAVAGRFGVQSIPTLVVLKDGVEADVRVGVTSASALAAILDRVLGQQ